MNNITPNSPAQMRNKTAVTGITIINVVLALAYLIELVKGERNVLEFLIIAFLTIAPCIIIRIHFCIL